VAETSNVRPFNAVIPFRPRTLALAALACMLAACTTSTEGLLSGQKVDYGSAAAKTKPLDVPPDLTQLARESRYQTQGGVVSASTAAAPAAARAATAAPVATPTVAVQTSGDVRIERQGQLRWLVTSKTPEQLWPQLRAFWEKNGFSLDVEDAPAGIMETNWNENRSKLPSEAVRNTIGSFLRNLYDTGERDRYRTRVERTANGSEVYISHRGAQEVYIDERRETTKWTSRPNDPGLEAEMLSRLMAALSGQDEQVRTAAAGTTPPAAGSGATPAPTAAPAAPARARVITTPGIAALEMDETFDRAWRQVGLALDRGGFSVEDRDRAAGLYYVRYVDPKYAGQEEPGYWARLFGNTSTPQAPVRYRVAVKGADGKSTVSVQTSAGGPDVGENGQRIVALLLKELR
jgi:outer membrane protein assembly factor BamC